MLGHADVGITLKIYHHVNARAMRETHRECSPLANAGNPHVALKMLVCYNIEH